MTDAAANPTPSSPGLWEDFIDIFYQPSQVFERRREGKFGLALLVLVVISGILFFALRNGIAPIMDAEMAKAAAPFLHSKLASIENPKIQEGSRLTGIDVRFVIPPRRFEDL